ncbi:tetratricopeptide repeat protein [Bacteroides sp. UBA939]|uniref:tetratricopeptide repeat protein n=1 Tax=Bacteroides sp. UBA939 TaxID=1946092 RepID=UPI0025C3F445|nr:hypothetical protein [Bacteroides sp. UBA939]
MKSPQNLLLYILILSGILASCNSRSRYSSALLALDDSVDTAPEMAVDSLRNMDTLQLLRKEKALYYLLLTRGLELSGKLPQNDSLLASPFSYYTKHKENKRLAQLYYLQGEIHRKGGFLIKAAESYSQAEKYGKDNKRLQFRLNIEMGRIYRRKLMEQEEDSCLNRALNLAVELGDSTLMSEAFYNLSLSCTNQKDYAKGKHLLEKAINLLPAEEHEAMSGYYKEMSQVCVSMQSADSALYYINLAISLSKKDENLPCNLVKGDVFMAMHRLDSAEYYFMQDTGRLSLSQKVEIYHKMHRLKDESGMQADASGYLEKHVMYRDSLDFIRKEDYIERRNNIQAYKRQREKANRAEIELANDRVTFYRVVFVSLLVIFALIAISCRKEQRKRKLEQQLESEQFSAMEIRVRQQETESQLLAEREERRKTEIRRLNQTVNYYKSLNAITIPALLKNQKGDMLHLTEEEWSMVVRNTDACFEDFTERLGRLYPQLTGEEIRFCCLVKMELSISLLAKIYHIAGGSVSRKKMRLKEKMGIENLSLDEFIQTF